MSVDREALTRALRAVALQPAHLVADYLLASGVLSPDGETTTEYAVRFRSGRIVSVSSQEALPEFLEDFVGSVPLSREATVTRTPWTVVES